MHVTRRNFLRLGAVAGVGAVAAGCGKAVGAGAPVGAPKSLKALESGGRGISHATGNELKRIPTACWMCVTRDGMIAYVEDGRLKKLEGNPELPRTNGKLCAKGQAGVNIVYNPDRVLYPLVRTGKRGEGKWKRISWGEALDLLVDGGEIAGRRVKGMKTLRDEGHPEKFMFHYGRMKGSDGKIIKDWFTTAYGTKTVGNHTSICESSKWTAQELTWGGHYDNWDFENTKFILNFGSNVLEAHTNHIPMAQRCVSALAKGVKMVTFDVRLSNTAAKSTEWVPVKPGTDLAVVLAMCNVVLEGGKVDKEFIETYTNVTVGELKKHFAQYTPEWAEGVSGVPAGKIRALATEYAKNSPGAVVISYRGAVMHYNGVQAERAILTLQALCGNIDVPGGRCRAVGAKWKVPFKEPDTKAKGLKIEDGKGYAYPTHHVSHQIFSMIRDGSAGRPDLYMIYCHNPVYVNGDCQANIDTLKDEEKMPFIVAVDVALSESSELADLVLPDATYLERWTADDMVCANQVPEYYIRQPVHAPLAQSRNFCDVVCDLAKRMGFDLGFSSAEEFVKAGCENTPGVKEAGGFEYMKAHGAWHDKAEKPKYKSHAKEVDVSKAELDEATGVYWEKHEGDKDFSSLDGKHAAKQYIAQKCGDGKARKGFPPDKYRWKTGFLEIRSKALEAKKFPALPSWMPVPEHEKMDADELVLTTFKVNTQVQSRSQNCKWLTELYHTNPAWINPRTAAARGIADGDRIKVTSKVGSITTTARVTEGVHPGVVAISNHCGHWAYGEYASLKKGATYLDNDADSKRIWWRDNGVHPNWIIPCEGDPIGGAMRWMDTVVKVEKA